jgi:hypothetical protein
MFSKCEESFESTATPQTDFKSTKESICQVKEVIDESLSPGPPVYFEFNENLNAKKEDIRESTVIQVRTNIHKNLINHSEAKTNLLRQKENVLKVAEAIEAQFTESVEGILNKRSTGLLSGGKAKFCRVYNDQLMIYKNWETRLLTGIVDFRLFPCSLAYNPSALTFRYSLT